MRVALSKRSERVIRLSSCISRLTSKRSEAQPSRKKASDGGGEDKDEDAIFLPPMCHTRRARAQSIFVFRPVLLPYLFAGFTVRPNRIGSAWVRSARRVARIAIEIEFN